MPSPRRRKPRRAPEHANHERWLVSYADFVTLLFAFFTAMYAISTVDARKLTEMVTSTREAFQPNAARDAGARARVGPPPLPATPKPAPPSSSGAGRGDVGLRDLERQITQRLGKQIAERLVDVETDQRGLVISIREAGAFAVGSAELSSDAQTLLQDLGELLSDIGNQVRVEGHTDDVPIHTQRFASNWELSTGRATTVVSFLLEHAGVHPEQVSAAGYAEYHPRVANSSEANRTRNRRVDLIVLTPGAVAAAR